MLQSPNTSKPAFQANPDAKRRVEQCECPCCASPIVESEFRNAISRKEYSISGMCQRCQDEIFNAPSTQISWNDYIEEYGE